MIKIDPTALRRLRRTRHATQADVADAIACSRNAISRAENGECSMKMAERIARHFAVDVKSLYAETEKAVSDPGVKLTNEEWRVVEVMRRSPTAAMSIWNFALGVEAAGHSQRQS